MNISILKSKIYRARLTDSSIEYSGSLGIDEDIMKSSGIIPWEKILVININTGGRFETYAIPEAAGSMKFTLYGGAARLGAKNDPVIIMSFASIKESEAKDFKPKIVNFDDNGEMIK